MLFNLCRFCELELNQSFPTVARDIASVPDQKKPTDGNGPKPSRLEEARRIIEEYAADLREIIRKLNEKMN